MDWNFAIECNRERLVAVVAELFAMIGLTEGGMVERRVAAGLPEGDEGSALG